MTFLGEEVKALVPIDKTPGPIVTEVRREQSRNASSPILVTELPMVTEVRPEQL